MPFKPAKLRWEKNCKAGRLARGVLWLGLAWTAGRGIFASAAGDEEVAHQAMSATSNLLASLPVRAIRAERALTAAGLDFMSGRFAEVPAGCERVVRLAAKELRDAGHDMVSTGGRDSDAFRAYGPIDEWARLVRKAEEARAASDYSGVLRDYAEAITRWKAFRRLEVIDVRITERLTKQAEWFKAQAPEAGEALHALHRETLNAWKTVGHLDTERRFEELSGALDSYRKAAESLGVIRNRFTPAMRKALKEYEETLNERVEKSAGRMKELLASRPDRPDSIEAWARLAKDTAESAAQLAAMIPEDVSVLAGRCPEPVARLVERALEERRRTGSSAGTRDLVRQSCRAAIASLAGLSRKDARACLESVAALSDDMDPVQARTLVRAAVASGLEPAALAGSSEDDPWSRLCRHTVPAGFEIVAGARPPIPVRKDGSDHGLVFADRQAQTLFESLPWKIRTGKNFFPKTGIVPMTFLLIPAGRLSFPDDEGRQQVLLNDKPFYMAAEETRWGPLAAVYGERKGDRAPAWNPAALRILAGSSDAILEAPATYADHRMIDDLCAWLNGRPAGAEVDGRDVFEPAGVAQWRFAACLDLLVRAAQEEVRPGYRWWKALRAKRQWDAATLRSVGRDDPGGWGFHHLFGNAAEWVRSPGASPRRCGGSYREASSPILSFPLYDREARDGEEDLGFRLVLVPLLRAE